ncbi:MAG: hypothetical protein R3324_04275 [Halobacteriales archaeon]|nr:hypothetical protein [Halobacteriales archaeon]
MSFDRVPEVRWWSWALDAVFFVVGIAYIVQGQLTWGLALIGFGVLAVGFDLWRRRLSERSTPDVTENDRTEDGDAEDSDAPAEEQS